MHWLLHLEGGPQRVNHAAVVLGPNTIFSFGGYNTGDDYTLRRPIDVHALSTQSYRWCSLPPPSHGSRQAFLAPYRRYGHTVVPYEDKAILWGGRNDGDGSDSKVYIFDGSTLQWQESPDISGKEPGSRDGHSACIISSAMYVFGGFEEEADMFSQEVWRLCLDTWHWSLVKPDGGTPPTWRDFHTATAYGDELMIVFGGRSDDSGPYHTNHSFYDPNLYAFNTRTRIWHLLDYFFPGGTGRRSHSAFIYRDALHVFGGYNSVQRKHYNDLVRFDLRTKEWSQVNARGSRPSERRRQACLLHGDRVFLFGGTSPRWHQHHNSSTASPGGAGQGGQVWDDAEEEVYNLVDQSDLHVLDLAPTLRTLAMLAVIRHGLPYHDLPRDISFDIKMMTKHNDITQRPDNHLG